MSRSVRSAATVLRPVADATNTLSILREILRGSSLMTAAIATAVPALRSCLRRPPTTDHGRPPVTVQAPGVPPWSTERDIGVRRTGTADLPSADITAVMLSRALIEVLAGRRSPQQLSAHCAPQVFAGLLLRIPPLAQSLPRLQTVRVCEPADGVAEACAVFRRAERVRALAFRLEGLDGRWRITVLQIG